MPSLVEGNLARRLTTDALLLCVALMLSYLEAIIPIVPLPGMRLGLAQSVVTLAYFRIGRSDAAILSAMRVVLMSLLFGSVTSGFGWENGYCASGAAISVLACCVPRFTTSDNAWLRPHCSVTVCSSLTSPPCSPSPA